MCGRRLKRCRCCYDAVNPQLVSVARKGRDMFQKFGHTFAAAHSEDVDKVVHSIRYLKVVKKEMIASPHEAAVFVAVGVVFLLSTLCARHRPPDRGHTPKDVVLRPRCRAH